MSLSSFSSSSNDDKSSHSVNRQRAILKYMALGVEILAWIAVIAVGVYLRLNDLHLESISLNWKMLCSDESLFGTQTEYINSTVLYVLVIVVPLVFILVGEVEHALFSTDSYFLHKNPCERILKNVPRTVRIFAMFILGVMLASLTADYLKILIQKPRPFFLAKYGGACPLPFNGTKTDDYYDALKSFPSHLSCVASFSCVFAIGYAHRMHVSNVTPILMTIVSKGFIVLALVSSINEYICYRNHLDDVVWALLIGLILALYMISLVVFLVRTKKTEENERNIFDFFLPRVTLPPTRSNLTSK